MKKEARSLVALVDCNNFYVSCERVFHPELKERPVVVLSNNDGCIIARSAEAKKLGIKMGIPAFHIEKLLADHQVALFSSNYALYGDFSARVMHILESFSPKMEVYSIDEAFLDLSGLTTEPLEEYARRIRHTVLRNTGIPVSIGIAATKTLAKIAGHVAKREHPGVSVLISDESVDRALKETEVGEVWGIGKQHAGFLSRHGILSAFDLAQAPENWIRKNLTVKGLRTRNELNGISCLPVEDAVSPRKAICVSRSFGKSQSEPEQVEEAVATFASRCAEKLRSQNQAASQMIVFIHTNGFRTDLPQYARNALIPIAIPTNNTIDLVRAAIDGVRKIFRSGFRYKKAGVIVTGLVPKQEIQQNLFSDNAGNCWKKLMVSLDEINRRMGHETLKVAATGTSRTWKLRQEKLSPCYTTHWNEIMEIHP